MNVNIIGTAGKADRVVTNASMYMRLKSEFHCSDKNKYDKYPDIQLHIVNLPSHDDRKTFILNNQFDVIIDSTAHTSDGCKYIITAKKLYDVTTNKEFIKCYLNNKPSELDVISLVDQCVSEIVDDLNIKFDDIDIQTENTELRYEILRLKSENSILKSRIDAMTKEKDELKQ